MITKTIAVIDDDVHIGNMLEEVLKREGYGVLRAYSGTEALYLLSDKKPDLILLDLMLPGLSGEELLSRTEDIPVIVVSARADVDSKVQLFMQGAADYITKPFEIRELLARIAVRMRDSRVKDTNIITKADITINTLSYEVTVTGKPVKLTKTEFAILKLLMINAAQAVHKNVILERISLDTPDCTETSLKQHISNLRKKLRSVNGKDYIESVWGIGFRFLE